MESDLLIGQQLGGYVIQAQLGEGGMARVYKAYQARLRRDVAIKVILAHGADNTDFQQRFEREAQLIASLEHPNIVAVYDFGEIHHLMYLVMQFVGGGTLREQLGDGAAIEPRRAALYALQMARALHHAHQRGIVHRDVKPQNMLVSSSDPSHLLLSDFGIAKLFHTEEQLPSLLTLETDAPLAHAGLTRADQVIGTPTYMAPEQINRLPVDARTDVYALGVVLYHLLAGQPPFQAPTVHGLYYQHVYTAPDPLQTYNPAVPDQLAQIVMHAMQKAPEARFPTAAAMADALETLLASRSTPVISLLSGTQTHPTLNVSPQVEMQPRSPHHPAEARTGEWRVGVGGVVGTARSTTGISVHGISPRPKRRWGLSLALTLSLCVLIFAYTGYRLISPQLPQTGQSASAQATAFVETFQDDQRSWQPASPTNGLTATLSNQQFVLTTGNVSATNYYFPYPAEVGTLPATFTLSTVITHNQGPVSAFYGLAFHLDQSAGVHSYAFVVNDNEQFAFLKFDPAAKIIPTVLQNGTLPSAIHLAMNQQSTLTVSTQNQTFRFTVDGIAVPLNGAATTTDTTSAAHYTGGQLALLVTGSESRFTVTKVQLALSA